METCSKLIKSQKAILDNKEQIEVMEGINDTESEREMKEQIYRPRINGQNVQKRRQTVQ